MAKKSVLMILGDFSEDAETMIPFQALQAFGIEVHAVCPGKKVGEICPTSISQSCGHHTFLTKNGHNFTLNATFEEIEPSNYDGLLIPGGAKTPEYLALNECVVDILRTFADKPIAAVCHGPLILAASGLLRGKSCTAFRSVGHIIKGSGGDWIPPNETLTNCVVDRNLITAPAWHANAEFLHNFVKTLGIQITGSEKRVLLLCGDFMEDYEATMPFYTLQAAGCIVDAVCPRKIKGEKCPTLVYDWEGYQTYTEKSGYNFTLNANFNEVNVDDYDALVVPGGRARKYLVLDDNVLNLVRKFSEQGKIMACIGDGMQILAAAGVLQGKQCTASPGVKLDVVVCGGVWIEPQPSHKCVVDGKLISASTWHANSDFVSKIMTSLSF